MPRKSKTNRLPSGSCRVSAYDYTDSSGKRHYKSFTAPTLSEAKAMRNEWKVLRKNRPEPPEDPLAGLTVQEAIERYIKAKEGVLSPSTLRGYDSLYSAHFSGDFGSRKLSDLTDQQIQLWVSDLSLSHSPKTVANIIGLFAPSMKMFRKDFSVQLPAKQHASLYCPSDKNIKRLIEASKEDPELEIAILLAAFVPLRRGEICRLKSTDVKDNAVLVANNLIEGRENTWVNNQPKTYESYRRVELPDFLIKKIQAFNGPIITCSPNAITQRFKRLLKRAGLPDFRFHDLRHYSASIMHAIGVPDEYIRQRGGWASNYVMKRVYINEISEEAVKQNKKINDHFKGLTP